MKIKIKRSNLCRCGSGKRPDKCCKNKLDDIETGPIPPPSDKMAKYQKAMNYHRAGNLEKAKEHYIQILKEEKNNPDIYLNLGQIYEKNGQFSDAKLCYEKALEIKPDYASVYNNMGIIFLRQENFDLAKSNFDKALTLNPNIPEAWNNLGLVFQCRKEYREAEAVFQKAISLKEDYADAFNNLGGVYIYQGKKKEAMSCFEKSISLDPCHAGAYNNIGNLYRFNDQLKLAETFYLRAEKINPDFPDAINNLGSIYGLMGRIKEANSFYKKALILKPDYKEAQSNLLLNLNYSPDFTPQEIFAEHLLFEKRFGEPLKSKIRPHLNDQAPDRKLKIGYVSPDFRTHSVDSFLEPVLSNHDPDLFEVYCYSNSTVWDFMTRQLHSYADYWRIITGLPDEQASQLIRSDQIDILIDLSGHTGHNRMLLFAFKPAPIQVTWLGYPNTTGLSTMDYRITDQYADPAGTTEQYHSEQLIRLPETFSCFRAPGESPEIDTLPALKNGYITFGSFNILAKVTTQVISVWAEILKSVQGSRLILKTAGLNEAEIKKPLYKTFGDLGITSDRIEFLGKDASRRDHFQRYNAIDIGLDPFPYNGTTTTCDALWMGVPVITLEGRTHVSRVGVSQMSNLGLAEVIAKTPEDYVEIAKRLSNDTAHLRVLREGMRARMLSSPLMDSKSFTRNLEKAYREIWKEYVSRNGQKNAKALMAMDQAQSFLKEGRLDEARNIYHNVLLDDPQNIDALHDLGIIAFQCRNFKLAIEFFIKALTIKPNDPVGQNNLGVAFYELGFKKEAKVCYETAISVNPDHAEAYYNLGVLFKDLGDINEAKGFFQKTLELRPNYAGARENLNKLSDGLTSDRMAANPMKAMKDWADDVEKYR
ncbi:MAG: tetratricopeptide repeat protein [Nitrospiria bacterium]